MIPLGNHYFLCAGGSIARKLWYFKRRSRPSLRNRKISRAGVLHRSEIALFHARGGSTARKLWYFTRWSRPSLRNRGIPRAGAVQPPENAESHALDDFAVHEQ